MPSAQEVIQTMEGAMSSIASMDEPVAIWLKNMKEVMLQHSLKDETDWVFTAGEDVDQDTLAILAAACDVYGLVIGSVSADAERDWFVMTDIAAGDFDGTAALDNDDLWIYQIPACATAGSEEFWPHVFPKGINFPAGLDVLADGRDGTNPAANDIRCWVVYRS